MKASLRTVLTFARIDVRSFFRDPLAIFFAIAFPLIFLLVFGSLNSGNQDLSFKIAIINQSQSKSATEFVEAAKKSEILKINSDVTSREVADEMMVRGELSATIVLPPDFGNVKAGQTIPSGQAKIFYTQNNEQAAQTLQSILEAQFSDINAKLVAVQAPFTVTAERINQRGLSAFDYVFAGLLGFAIVGLGIFGPVNVFPDYKKRGILRRLHTTPLRVWQYFLSTALSQSVVGLLAIAIMFGTAIVVFDLQVVGNVLALALFVVLSIIMILGIGLALGGWAKNERQVAPLANIIVFPMLFLSGTFFPRFAMPEWLQKVSEFLPLTPVIDGIRLITTEGKTLIEIAPQIGLITIWGIIIYLIAFRVFRWE